jgi:HD-GYP domain-containing protein (c-di-GMP phosphodiesterase class II)
MSETQVLLGKIRALRQRLEQAQGLAGEAGAAAAQLASQGEETGPRLRLLTERVAAGLEHHGLLDGTIRQLGDLAAPAEQPRVLPAQLTARARRVLERGRDLLVQLRSLADDFVEAPVADEAPAGRPAPDPLAVFYRETLAMTDTTLRTVQAFPDAPSAQLRLCDGLEAFHGVIAQRVAVLGEAVARRRREAERVARLGDLLPALHAGTGLDVKPYVALAEALLEEAEQDAPLRFLYEGPEPPARFVACHSLSVAQVVARVVRGDPEWRGRTLEPVLAALVHDAGMLDVPAEVLAQPGPLRGRTLEPVLAALVHDAGMLDVPAEVLAQPGPLGVVQRRHVEGHARAGAALAARLLPDGPWLAEAVAGHHERMDGTGYPGGLRALQVAALPRLLAVCDVYAALCAPRPHRPAREPRTALTDTLLLAEQGALDRNHAERLLELSFYPVGSVVELADGAVGVVVATPAPRRDLSAPGRPVLAVLADALGRPLPLPQHLDLAHCESRSIVRSLSHAERRDLLGRRYPELA